MKENKKMPSNSITITYEGNTYEVNFPNNGQFIDIEKMKAKMTDGFYSEMKNGSGNGFYASLIVDMIATFSILCKELLNDLNTKNIFQLNLIQTKPLLDIYKKDYLPWFDEWSQILSDVEVLDEEETKK